MSVCKGNRKESKVEFDNTFFKVYEDCVELTTHNFGAKDEITSQYTQYINKMSDVVLKIACDIIAKDCNRCGKSIQRLDALYNELFPIKDKYNKPSRNNLINETLKEYGNETYSTYRQ